MRELRALTMEDSLVEIRVDHSKLSCSSPA